MKNLLYLSILLPLFAFTPGENTETFEGIARDIDSKTFIYKEIHKEIFTAGEHKQTQTYFVDAKGEAFAERTLDFSQCFVRPIYALDDSRTGLQEKIEHLGDNRFRIYFRENETEKADEKIIEVPAPAVVDGGFNYFIKQSWDKIQKDEKVVFNFISASFQTYFSFRIYRVSGNNSDPNTLLRMESNNFFLRALMSPVYIEYNSQTKQIKNYKGISNIRDITGDSYVASLVYPERGP